MVDDTQRSAAPPVTRRVRVPGELAPRGGKIIIAVTTGCYFAIAALSMLGREVAGPSLGFGLAALLVLMLLQNLNSLPSRGGPRPRYWIWTLSAQAVLTYVPFLTFGASWVGMPGFLAGTLLLWLNAPVSWLMWSLVVGSIFAVEWGTGTGVADSLYYSTGTVISSLTIFGLTRLVDLVIELRRARAELARLAVAEERIRVARDLHDLLGYSLSAITLKGELAYRLVSTRPERAREEITAMLGLSRQALADVRIVASRYRHMSLDSEASAGQAILASAGIDTTVSLRTGALDDELSTALATVLREGVTNLLRHSKAQSCTIRASVVDGRVRLELANDGVGSVTAEPGRRGTGLENLAARMRELGGELRTDCSAGSRTGWFTLTAEVPLRLPEQKEGPGTDCDLLSADLSAESTA